MFIVHIDFGHHWTRDFEIKENPARSHEEAAISLCRMVGGLTWEVR
jgi:hypothetical protein